MAIYKKWGERNSIGKIHLSNLSYFREVVEGSEELAICRLLMFVFFIFILFFFFFMLFVYQFVYIIIEGNEEEEKLTIDFLLYHQQHEPNPLTRT